MGCSSSRPPDASANGGVSLVVPDGLAVGGGGPRTFSGAHDDELVNGVAAGCAAGEWLSCAEDKLVALTDWRAGRVAQLWRGHERGVNRVLPAPHIDGAISCSRDTTVRLWKRGDEAPAATLRGHELSVSAIALSADGSHALSGSRDSSLQLWDLAASSSAARVHISRNVVTCVAWAHDEPHLVVQGSEDLRLRVWDVRTLSQPAQVFEGYVYFPLCCATHGPHLATGSNGFDGTGCEVRLWERRMSKQLVQLNGHEQAVHGVAFVPNSSAPAAGRSDSSLPLLASAAKDGEVRLWDASTADASAPPLASMRFPAGYGVSGLAAARVDETDAALYASTTNGAVHALATAGDGGAADVRLVATGS